MNLFQIYITTCRNNNKKYVGFTGNFKVRQRSHKYQAHIGSPHAIHRAIRKHGWDNFDWEMVYTSDNKKHVLNEMEPYFIRLYDTTNQNYGYNQTSGGEYTILNEEAKRKISISKLGKPRSPETIAAMSRALKGKPLSPEHKQAVREGQKRRYAKHPSPLKGRTLSEEHKNKLIQNSSHHRHTETSKAKISKANGQTWFIRFPDTHIEKIFSMNAFCEKHNLSISAMSKISGSGRPHKEYRCAKSLSELENIVKPYAEQKKKKSQEHMMKIIETRLKTGCMKGHVSPMKGKNHTDAAKEQNRLKHLGKFSNAVDRYRIGDHKFRTIQQIARFLHVSTEKVRQKIVNGEIKDSTFTLHTNGGQQLRGDNPSHLYGAMMQAK